MPPRSGLRAQFPEAPQPGRASKVIVAKHERAAARHAGKRTGKRAVVARIAQHDLPGHPEHTRELDLRGPFLTVTDQVAGLGRHHLRLHLHLHPDCEVQPESR
ncbi:MAG: heparinase II/III family protein, partial [Novosphingobium meiothermophilum]